MYLSFSSAKRELTALISEIMMYVIIVVLQLWLIGVLIYCYKKIYAENEAREARNALRGKKKWEFFIFKSQNQSWI